jgi:uncharacterized membrane protein YdbT with pleckstrin-like domain
MSYSSSIHKKFYERIIYLLRRDFLTFLPQIIIFLILVGIEVVMYFLLKEIFPSAFENPVWRTVLILLGSVYALSIWMFFYTAFNDYYLDIWIVTNDRIVDIRQSGLFGRTIAELDLYRVQDVKSECNGMFATMFNYGNVYIQTAGETGNFVFRNVPNPHHIREEIVKLAEEDRKYHIKKAEEEKSFD